MVANSVGRPPKATQQKRQQLQFSLYSEDIERLGQLTDNRSEFIRQCITKAWNEKYMAAETVTITVPKWLLEELFIKLKPGLPARQANLLQALVEELLAES
jgi:hypothetical protein